jgi:hypothetical protein
MAQGKKNSYLMIKKNMKLAMAVKNGAGSIPIESPQSLGKKKTFKSLKTIEKVQRTQRIQCLTHFTS